MSAVKSAKYDDASSRVVLAPISALPFTARHQEALDLELSLLTAVLNRNGSSHRRTQYFRRLTMAVTSIHRHLADAVWSDWQALVTRDLQRLEQELEKERKLNAQIKKRQEIFWELKVGVKSTQPADSVSTLTSALTDRVADLSNRTAKGIAECISRLEYAAEACFIEISRGFFLALLTVAVGCTARIRTLLLRLQNHAAAQIQTALHKSSLWKEGRIEEFRSTLVDAMESIRSSSPVDTASPKVFTRAELTAASLRSLGIVLPGADVGSNGKSDVPIGVDRDAPTEEFRDEDSQSIFSNSRDRAGALVKATAAEEQDLGESVGISMELQDKLDAEGLSNGTLSQSEMLKSQVDDASVDQNAAVLQKLKEQKKASNDKAKKSKNEGKRSAASDGSAYKRRTMSTEDTSSKPKKRRNKKKDGDFFDALFG